jgi:hypothetical protein
MKGRLLQAVLRPIWPGPLVDRLLRAALAKELNAAAAWRAYEAAVDFHGLTPAEVELLGLVAGRLATLAPESPMRPRIGGIARKNWSRTQLAVAEAGTGLRALDTNGVAVLLTEGAARIATDGASAGGRLVATVDFVVRPADLEKAYELLTKHGWSPTGSGAAARDRPRRLEAVGLELVRGQFGSLRLHSTPYPWPHASKTDDASVWERSTSATMAQAAVRTPSASDALAISLAQSGESGYRMVDIAAAVDRGVDWELFVFLADRHRLHAPGIAGLRYVRDRLERPVPDSVLRRLERAAICRPVRLAVWMMHAPPEAGGSGAFGQARAVVRQLRRLGSRWRSVLPPPDRRDTRMESRAKAE